MVPCAITYESATIVAPRAGRGMDIRLVVQAQSGDEEAFATLTDAIVDRFHGVARNILRDPGLAEDAVQGALVRVWRDLPTLRDLGSQRFEAWSYRLLVNACYAEARRMRRWMPSVLASPVIEPADADAIGPTVDRDQLERGFRRLSVDHRAVVVLHHYLELPLDRIAAVLGVPEGTVRSRLHRAMQGLRAALEADARPQPGITAPTEAER